MNYKKSRKKTTMVSAMCFLFAAGIALGTLAGKNNTDVTKAETALAISKNNNAYTENLEMVYANANDFSEKESVEISNDIELHVNEKPVYTMEEVDALIDEGIAKYERYGRDVISTDRYAEGIKSGSIDINSIESKSYIYHQMLNSIDNFNNAEGSMTYALNMESPIYIDFQTDIEKGESYENDTMTDLSSYEFYVSDEVMYAVDSSTREYGEMPCASPVEFVIEDNNRVITLDDGESLKINRNDLTNLGIAGNSCLFPQSYATAYLCDFDTWSVADVVYILDRMCVQIEGKNAEQSFTATVDIDTGIMLKYEVFDENGELIGYTVVDKLFIDGNMKVNKFNKEAYIKTENVAD